MQQHDHRAGGFADDPIDQIQRMLGALPQSDESNVGPFAGGYRSDILDADLAGDDLVAERRHDRGNEREPVLALVGDQDAKLVGSIGERRHAPILVSIDRVLLEKARPKRLAGQCSSGSSDLAGVRATQWSSQKRFTPVMSVKGPPSEQGPSSRGQAFWRDALEPYIKPDRRRSLWCLLTSAVPYLALFVLMVLSLRISYLLTLALAIPTAGFLVRTYIVFHDCAHGSFLPSRRANRWLGASLGLLVFQPFECWKHHHAIHHATAGDLDRRGVGDLPTLTVAEYQARRWRGRLAYRLFRNPLVMFGLGPIFALIVQPRIVPRSARPHIKRSVMATNVAVLVLVAGLCWLMGWRNYLLVEVPTAMLAGAAGIWLFYVQHQFENVYWENSGSWSYADAALRGSSYLRLPKVLQFFSGNIGLHHVHHLSARIPNYNLQRAHDENPIFHDVPTLSLIDGLRAVRLKLYDPESGRMMTFAQARASSRATHGPLAKRERTIGLPILGRLAEPQHTHGDVR
jgi:acyl-lipid omega-6 desaturase (Delta-12 desaturase)